MGDNFETIMTSYFEDIKKSMKERIMIPVSLVEKNYDDVWFPTNVDYTYVQVTTLRVRWLRPLGYEINVDEASTTIIALLAEEVDKTTKVFGNYETMKSKIDM